MPAIKHISVGPPTQDDLRNPMTARSINTSLVCLLARLVLADAALNQTSTRPFASVRRRHSESLLARHQASSRGRRTGRPTPLPTTGWRRRCAGFWVVEARPKLLAHASRTNSAPVSRELAGARLITRKEPTRAGEADKARTGFQIPCQAHSQVP